MYWGNKNAVFEDEQNFFSILHYDVFFIPPFMFETFIDKIIVL